MTHGLAVRGTGGTAAGAAVQIGADITLPAGGPWVIHGIWGNLAQATAVADESTDWSLKLDSASGDITPDPAPGLFPGSYVSAPVSAAFGDAAQPTMIWPTEYVAAGKSVIRLKHVPHNALAVAPNIAAGIIFSDAIPVAGKRIFIDRVQADFASATEQQLGTVTLAEKATKINGLLITAARSGAPVADIPIIGTGRLDSDDLMIKPAEYPFAVTIPAGDGTVAGAASMPRLEFIELDIPVVSGARIDCFAITNESVTNSASIAAYISYE